ncbi:MAG: hypothetical protein ACYC3S_16065, partial [Chloroflexota bacterium]
RDSPRNPVYYYTYYTRAVPRPSTSPGGLAREASYHFPLTYVKAMLNHHATHRLQGGWLP